MPFGLFAPSRTDLITNKHGETVVLNTPEGYSGLFWGRVYDADGNRIKIAHDYFWHLGQVDYPDDDFKYWGIIDSRIAEHCDTYILPYCGKRHHYQSGFGGDESDGLVDFWTEKPIPEMPDMPFEISGNQYVMKWEYSSGEE